MAGMTRKQTEKALRAQVKRNFHAERVIKKQQQHIEMFQIRLTATQMHLAAVLDKLAPEGAMIDSKRAREVYDSSDFEVKIVDESKGMVQIKLVEKDVPDGE